MRPRPELWALLHWTARTAAIGNAPSNLPSLYYKIPDGSIYGPFPYEDIELWRQRGFISNAIPVSETTTGPFMPLSELAVSYVDDNNSYNDNKGTHSNIEGNSDNINSEVTTDFSQSPKISVKSIKSSITEWSSEGYSSSTSGSLLLKLKLLRPDKAKIVLSRVGMGLRRAVNPLLMEYLSISKDSYFSTVGTRLLLIAVLKIVQLVMLVQFIPLFCGSMINSYLSNPNLKDIIIYSPLDEILGTKSKYLNSWFVHAIFLLLFHFSFMFTLLPALVNSAYSKSSIWHFEKMMKNDFFNLKSKFEFQEEGRASVKLLISNIFLFSVFILSIIATLSLKSTAYAASSAFIFLEVLRLFFSSARNKISKVEDETSEGLGFDDENENPVILRSIVERIENIVFQPDSVDFLLRWPNMLHETLITRRKYLSKLLELTKAAQVSFKTFFGKQVLWTFFIIIETLTILWLTTGNQIDPKSTPQTSLFHFFERYLLKEFQYNKVQIADIEIYIRFSVFFFIQKIGPVALLFFSIFLSNVAISNSETLVHLWNTRLSPYALSNSIVSDIDTNRWNSDGPDKTLGIRLDHVTAVGGGRVRLRDISMQINPGEITALVARQECRDRLDAILEAVWNSNSDRIIIQRGTISIHGRDSKEWGESAIKQRITFLKSTENIIPCNLGALCGIKSGSSIEDGERQTFAMRASGALGLIKRLSSKGIDDDILLTQASTISISPAQRHQISLCRALSQFDRDIIILDGASQFMNDQEEKDLILSLKSVIRPDQIVIITSSRASIAESVDKVISLD